MLDVPVVVSARGEGEEVVGPRITVVFGVVNVLILYY